MEQIIKPKTLPGFIHCLAGLFITKDNPLGLTPKELKFLAALYSLVLTSSITKEHKIEISNQFNHKLQVTINYINKLKKKGVVLKDNKLHPVFFKTRIIIEYGE